MVAFRAAVVAEMADIHSCVVIRRAAANAVLRVGGVLKAASSLSRIVQTEADGVTASGRQIGDDGIIGIHNERRRRRKPCSRSSPALGDDLELPVAIELVAEQVPERDDAWLRPFERLGKRSLVDLEEAELSAACSDESGRDPGEEIGAGAIPGEFSIGAENLGGHRGRRRLAVGCRDEHDPVGEPSREGVHGAGIDLPQHFPGKRRASAAPDGARQ